MALKLFALEEMEEMDQTEEMEAAPEVGEVSDVITDTEETIDETEEMSEGIEEGLGATSQLEEVQEVVERAADEGGLDPVAAEAVRIAIEAICTRINANPKTIYAVYATENFQSASSKQANTQIALEGIKEFTANVWERIKKYIIKLWEKVVAFWDKHFSDIGRVKKALESMVTKVKDADFKTDEKTVEASNAVMRAFASDDITTSLVEDKISEVKQLIEFSSAISKTLKIYIDISPDDFYSKLEKDEVITDQEIGSEDSTLVYGKYYSYKLEIANKKFIFNRQVGTAELNFDEGEVEIPSKVNLIKILRDTLETIAAISDVKKEVTKTEIEVKKIIDKLDKNIKKTKDDPEAVTAVKLQVKVVNDILSKLPLFFNDSFKVSVWTGKAVLTYSSLILSKATKKATK